MARFRYCLDPLFLLGCAAYSVNRWVLLPVTASSFLRGHFNDLWLIPCALPPVLWVHRRLGLRTHDGVPQISEITWHLVFWSVFCEWIGPAFVVRSRGDILDVAAYAFGAFLAVAWWQWRHRSAHQVAHEF